MGQATRRRKRGIAAQSLLRAVLLFAENMRRIEDGGGTLRASWWARGDLNPHVLSDTGT